MSTALLRRALRRPGAGVGCSAAGCPRVDVLVIGGGISGVQIARHCAARGLATLLVEKEDFGSGTSAATTKAIHGGLRYLEQGDIPVVVESLRERRLLGLAAPHLVQPRSFLLTAYDWSTPRAPILGAGVGLYEALALGRNRGIPRDVRARRPRWVRREELLTQVPWLKREGLVGAWRHDDSLNLHPERLLLAILQSAVDDGAVALNHARVTGLLPAPQRGVRVRDELTGESADIQAEVIINAAGPWAAEALGVEAQRNGVAVAQSKGVHLMTRDLGNTDGVYVRGANGHHIVVNPWDGRQLIGPTDTPMDGSPDDAQAEVSDIELLRETFDSVAETPLRREDVVDTLVGVRPLLMSGDSTYTSSRRFDIIPGQPGVYTVLGGKWTTGRAMGEKVSAEIIAREAGLPPTKRISAELPLHASMRGYSTMNEALDAAVRAAPHLGLGREQREHLARMYGEDHVRILGLVAEHPELGQPLERQEAGASGRGCLDCAAQVVYAVEAEGACTLRDVVDRRLSLGTRRAVSTEGLDAVCRVLTRDLGWDAARLREERDAYDAAKRYRAEILDQGFACPSSALS